MVEEIRVYIQKGKLVVNGFTDANTLANIVNVLTADDRVERATKQIVGKPGKGVSDSQVEPEKVSKRKKYKKSKKSRKSRRYQMTWGGKPTSTAKAISFLQNKGRAGFTKIKITDVITQARLHRTGSSYGSVRSAALKLGYKVGKEGRHLYVYFGASLSKAFPRSVVGRPRVITEDMSDYIIKNQNNTTRKLSKLIAKHFGVHMSPNTVNRFMHEKGIRKRRHSRI